jgi:hypothetical protein
MAVGELRRAMTYASVVCVSADGGAPGAVQFSWCLVVERPDGPK